MSCSKEVKFSPGAFQRARQTQREGWLGSQWLAELLSPGLGFLRVSAPGGHLQVVLAYGEDLGE